MNVKAVDNVWKTVIVTTGERPEMECRATARCGATTGRIQSGKLTVRPDHLSLSSLPSFWPSRYATRRDFAAKAKDAPFIDSQNIESEATKIGLSSDNHCKRCQKPANRLKESILSILGIKIKARNAKIIQANERRPRGTKIVLSVECIVSVNRGAKTRRAQSQDAKGRL